MPPIPERELTEPIDLCVPPGRLNPRAVGWSRRPIITADLGRWGRRKRWEYWAVMSPEAVLAVTISDLDYAGLYAIWFATRDGAEHGATALAPLPRLAMPERAGGGPVQVRTKDVDISLTPGASAGDSLRIRATGGGVEAELLIADPASSESMGVVVPWSARRFQYTVKETCLAARGTVTADGVRHEFGEDSWATWDFGRGKWPYRIDWNWGSGAGRQPDGRLIGLQFGGKWTDGTPMTENAIFLDGRCFKISQPVRWHYRQDDWLAPWHLDTPDGQVTLEFRPHHVRTDRTNLGVLANDTHQCFGTWHGTVDLPDASVEVDGLRGWAEEVRNRW